MNTLAHVYPKFVFNINPDIVFKSCKDWIVVMKKNPDTETNELRSVVNEMYAKYRANKLRVIKIFNKLNPTATVSHVSSNAYEKKSITYRVGQCVYVKEVDFDTDMNNVCSTGIHYFKSVEAAFYFELPKKYTGPYYKWSSDGDNVAEGYYENDLKTGSWISYYSDRHVKEEGQYENDLKTGLWTYYYSDGNIFKQGHYLGGLQNDKWVYSYNCGTKQQECTFVTGLMQGKCNMYWSPTFTGGKEILCASGTMRAGVKVSSSWLYYSYDGSEIIYIKSQNVDDQQDNLQDHSKDDTAEDPQTETQTSTV